VTPPSTLTFGRPDPLVEGDAQSQARAREQLRREQRLALAHKKGWPELNPNDLKRTLAGQPQTVAEVAQKRAARERHQR
jgi:hypothetical protein